MSSGIAPLLDATRRRFEAAVELLAASLARYRPFDPAQTYTPVELEPCDAVVQGARSARPNRA